MDGSHYDPVADEAKYEDEIGTISRDLIRFHYPVPIEWTSIPFPVKAIKIILSDLQNALGSGPAASRTPGDDMGSVASDDEVLSFSRLFTYPR